MAFDKITDEHIAESKNIRGWELRSTAYVGDDLIESIELDYHVYQNVDIATARILYLDALKSLLNCANNNIAVRPYLAAYPFTSKNADLRLLFFHPTTHTWVNEPFVACVFLMKDKIYYFYFDKVADELQDFHEETYEEALRLLQEQQIRN